MRKQPITPAGDQDFRYWAYAAFLLVISLAYCLVVIRQGWIPHDEGTMAQMAERCLHGEIPHRDFDELYSGGLTWLNAGAFRLWGIKLLSLRIPLVTFYLLFLFTIYTLACRWLSYRTACLLTLACLGWGLPVYFAPLPSWYLTFFAGFGTFFLMKYAETEKKRWLFAAGVMGGLSICFKILGGYFLLAGIFFLLYREATHSAERINIQPKQSGTTAWFTSFFAFLLVSGGLTLLFWSNLGPMEWILFLLPVMLLTVMPFYTESSLRTKTHQRKLWNAWLPIMLFLLAGAIPIFGFLLFNGYIHALASLLNGVFVQSRQHYQFASLPLPPLKTLAYAVPLPLLFWQCSTQRRSLPNWLAILAAAVLALIVLTGSRPWVYHRVWFGLRPMVLVITAWGIYGLVSKTRVRDLSSLERQRLFLILSVMVFTSLVQFPFPFGVYFCYVAPFVALGGVAVFEHVAGGSKELGALALVAYTAFGFLWLARSNPITVGFEYNPRLISAQLLPEKAGLVMGKPERDFYELLVTEIQKHGAGSDYIYAGPDCPQVYFLSGKKNPTRVLFEFLAPKHATTELILKAIAEHNVHVVVLNADPEFSPKVSGELYQAISHRFLHHENINQFRLFWR